MAGRNLELRPREEGTRDKAKHLVVFVHQCMHESGSDNIASNDTYVSLSISFQALKKARHEYCTTCST